MKIIRVKEQYADQKVEATIRSAMVDNRLTWKARGLLAYIKVETVSEYFLESQLDFPEIVRAFPQETRVSLEAALSELQANGYINLFRNCGELLAFQEAEKASLELNNNLETLGNYEYLKNHQQQTDPIPELTEQTI